MRIFILLLVTSLIVGCSSIGEFTPGSSVNFSKESVYVIGTRPSNFHITIWPGKIKDGYFYKNAWDGAALWGKPTEGYLIGKIKSGTTLAITEISKHVDSGGWSSEADWAPCDGAAAFYFTAEPGKVVYITDVEYRESDDGIKIDYQSDFEGAKKFIARNFPELVSKLEKGNFDLAPGAIPCTSVNILVI